MVCLGKVDVNDDTVQLWLALHLLKSERSRPGKIVKVGDALLKKHFSHMPDIKDQSDVDSEVAGADAEVAGADAEVASPMRAGILCRHSSCPEDDTKRRAWFFFHLI